MPYEMKQTEIAEALGISRSAVSQWRLTEFTIPAVVQAARLKGHSVEPIWLHALQKLDELAEAMDGSTQVNSLANELLDNPLADIPDFLLARVIAAANGKANLARKMKELRENSDDWIARRSLEDCLTQVINQANMALGDEMVTQLTRGGMTKRRAREFTEALDSRVFDWIEQIVRTANFEPTYDRPQGYQVFDAERSGQGQAGETGMAAKKRKKA